MLEPIAQQFGMSIGKDVQLWWHTDPERKVDEPVQAKLKEPVKCDSFAWSPKGTYLVGKDQDVKKCF